MFSSIILETAESSVLFGVVLVAAIVFLIILYIRIRPILHRPKIVRRRETVKPIVALPAPSPPTPVGSSPEQGQYAQITMSADREELLQMKSRWEEVLKDAASMDSLSEEQRQAYTEEARKRIQEIDQRLSG